MEIKDFYKIKKLLGDDYHICLSYTADESIKWVLYKYYIDHNVYFSNDNKSIMSSDTNTYEELLDFAKKHHKYDIAGILNIILDIIMIITCILVIVNIIYKMILPSTLLVIQIITFGIKMVNTICDIHNHDVRVLEIQEQIKKRCNNGN